MTHEHRKKSDKKRNGRSDYEKGKQHNQSFPSRKLLKGYCGSADRKYVKPGKATLADIWPTE